MPPSLLAPDEPPPVTILRENGASDIFLTADHAGRLIPRALPSVKDRRGCALRC